jgi:hypothetical protein
MTNHPQPEEPRALIIGDVHGKWNLLRQLLEQEGIVNEEGERINKDVEIIQVGDLGDFRKKVGEDLACYRAVQEGLIDLVLWGNHDRCIRDKQHQFNGYHQPGPTMTHLIKLLEVSGKIRWAHAIHGYLLTHAGLHDTFAEFEVPEGLNKNDPYDVADYLNQNPEKYTRLGLDELHNSVCKIRGGMNYWGGIIWRDFSEALYDRFPQVFGHSSAELVRQVGKSYCIDLSKHNALGAIWLPDKKIVRIDGNG